MKNRNRAFTLIELLVVIAIIAILAAILFPVFAQAKMAAKASASLSNTKQMVTGSLMYAGDTDDTFPSAQTDHGTGFVDYLGVTIAPWSTLVYPYTKSMPLINDPVGPGYFKSPTLNDNGNLSIFGNMGYNYEWLAPFTGSTIPTFMSRPISATAPASPAETVFATTVYSVFLDSNYITSIDAKPVVFVQLADCPDYNGSPSYAVDAWGKNSYFGPIGTDIKTVAAGRDTGGVAFRGAGNAITSFTDGHAKALKPGVLASGTNWNPNLDASALKLTDESKYLWDTK